MRPRSPDPRDVSLERPPRDLDALQLLVAERKIRGAQGVVVAVHDELAIEALGARERSLIDAGDAAAGEPQISAIAAGGAQLTAPLAVRGAALGSQAIDLGLELFEDLVAVLLLPLGFLGVVADDIATPTLPITDGDFLDLEVVGELLVPTGSGEHCLRDLTAAVDRHAQDVLAAAPGEDLEVGLRPHPGIADEHTAAELPALQILLDPLDRGDIDRVARADPMSDREAVARDREPNDDLRCIEASVLGVTALPERPGARAAGSEAAVHFVPFPEAAILLVNLEVQRGGVVEHDLDA